MIGEDYKPYGLEANHRTLETFIDYSHEQGLVESALKVEEIFAPKTINVARMWRS